MTLWYVIMYGEQESCILFCGVGRRRLVVIRFVFFLSHLFVVFLVLWEAARELRTEGKRLGYLLTQTLLLGSTTILWLMNVFLNQ